MNPVDFRYGSHMDNVAIEWKIHRLDEGEEPDLRDDECVLEIDSRIVCAGKPAGLLYAHYLFAEKPETGDAFRRLWDLDGGLCHVYEEITDDDSKRFLDPLPRLLDPATGILCVHFIALRPPFRHIGLGREVMRQLCHDMADARVGAVLLDTTPLQHKPHGCDHFDEEVRDLPWNGPEKDRAALVRHFQSWGMQSLAGTRFMIAAPEALRDSRAPQWPPGPVLDQWNACAVCGGWIDLDGHEWIDTEDGPVHLDCE
jgi:hypothetical protein